MVLIRLIDIHLKLHTKIDKWLDAEWIFELEGSLHWNAGPSKKKGKIGSTKKEDDVIAQNLCPTIYYHGKEALKEQRERVENEKCAWVSDGVSASQEKNIFPFLEKSSTIPKHSRHGVKT